MVNKIDKRVIGRLRDRLRADDVLYTLACFGVGLAGVTFPALGAVAIFIKIMQKADRTLPSSKLRRTFYSLKQQAFITVDRQGSQCILSITQKGDKRVQIGALCSKI